MARQQLSDQQIQTYLDNLNAGKKPDKSVENLPSGEVKKYRLLYEYLRKDIPLALPATFSDMVMARISEEGHSSGFELWQLLLAVVGFICGIGATFYLDGFKFISALNPALLATITQYFSGISKFINGLPVNLGLLATGLMMLIIMSLLDSFLNSSRRKSLFMPR